MRLANIVCHVRCIFKKSGFVIVGVSLTTFLGACATHKCDSTGASASHCAPVKMHVWTGGAFEEDKNFYYRKTDQTGRSVRDVPPTALVDQALKGREDHYKVWSNDGQVVKAIFVKR